MPSLFPADVRIASMPSVGHGTRLADSRLRCDACVEVFEKVQTVRA